MPSYTYICEKCSKTENVFHKMDSPKPPKCPKCNLIMHILPTGGFGFKFKESAMQGRLG